MSGLLETAVPCAAVLLVCVALAVGAGVLLDYMERKATGNKNGKL